MSKNAIIIGATSGIGKALAEVLALEGYTLGLTGRREPLLEKLKSGLSGTVYTQKMDVTQPEETLQQFEALLGQMGSVDMVIISAGVGHPNPELDMSLELETINTNVSGFVVIADAAYRYFAANGGGQIVGLSSIAALRGTAVGPAYGASKAFVSNYMEGLRVRSMKEGHNIKVIDVRPGFVDTPLAKGDNLFWVAPPLKAAKQIFSAVKRNKARVYITKRWRLVAWLLKVMPERMLAKM